MLSLVLLAAIPQATAAPSTPVAPQLPPTFSVAPVVAEPVRLALSPMLDGKIEPEEWDAFASASCESFFQWEPGKLHAAAKLAQGQDLVVTLDLRGDGWLQGSDNVELRIKWTGTATELAVRRLDASRPEGPAWVDAANLAGAAKVVGAVDGDKWTAEVSISDPGLGMVPLKAESQIGVRIDAVAPTDLFAEPFLPRATGLVKLQMERGSNLPTGFQWKSEFRGRTVVPGESIRIRLAFNGSDLLNFKRIDMRTEGLAKNETSSSGLPFPAFDRKNRSFVDYSTDVHPSASNGWRVLRGTITDGEGKTTVVQTSYEISPVVQFEFEAPKKLQSSSEPQVLRLATFIRSNTRQRVNGIFRIEPSQTFKVVNGDAKPIIIYNARGSKRQVFEIEIPGGYKGALPITMVAEVGVQTHRQTIWLNIP